MRKETVAILFIVGLVLLVPGLYLLFAPGGAETAAILLALGIPPWFGIWYWAIIWQGRRKHIGWLLCTVFLGGLTLGVLSVVLALIYLYRYPPEGF